MTRTRLSWANRIALVAALLFSLFPIFWLLSTSFKPWHEFVSASAFLGSWLPSSPVLDNYHDVFYPYVNQVGWPQSSSWRSLVSSTVISALATLVSIVFGLMAAIAFARYRVGGSWLPIYVLSFRMIPPIAIAIPVAVLLAPLNVTNTPMLLPPIYAAITVPLSTWMLKSFIEQIPHHYEEAAMLDGMSRWQAHFRITVPMIKGGLGATFLFVFVLNWTETPIALALAQGRYVTIPVQIIDKVASPHVQVALAVLALVPPLVIGVIIQRHLGRGFTFGTIKG